MNVGHDTSLHEYVKNIGAHRPDWMRMVGERAAARFSELEWPTNQSETWRRTSIASYRFDEYRCEYSGAHGTVQNQEVPEGYSGAILYGKENTIVASRPEVTAQGVYCIPFAGVDAAGTIAAAQSLCEYSIQKAENKLEAWHYALITHGSLCVVPRGISIEQPLLIQIDVPSGTPIIAPHVLIIAEESSHLEVVVEIRHEAEGEVLCLDGADFSIAANASVNYTTIECLNIDSTYFSWGCAHIADDARMHHSTNLFGSMLAKTHIDAELEGKGSDVLLDGIYFGTEDQQFDMRTVQIHKAPNTTSRTFYKGAAKDESHTVYQGLIQVLPDAAGTDAYLTNNNIMLNDGARADSIPSLNIETDDVRCSHGSTTGKLDAFQLFYLQSRGYTPHEAASLLLQGFFEEIIARMAPPIQDNLRTLINDRIM